MTVADFAYVQPRLQARHGQLLDAQAWGFLHGIKDFPAFLENARATALARWLRPFNSRSGSHEIEIGLRGAFRGYVEEVAGWVPRRWRAAVLWVRVLPDLPAFDHLLAGRPAPSWMRRDPVLQRILSDEGTLRLDEVQRGDWTRLAAAGRSGVPLRAAWTEQWRERWPAGRRAAALERLLDLMARHGEELAVQQTPQAAWNIRQALAASLLHEFRRNLLQPAAVFVHLLLAALELERLRAELLTRRIFGLPPEL